MVAVRLTPMSALMAKLSHHKKWDHSLDIDSDAAELRPIWRSLFSFIKHDAVSKCHSCKCITIKVNEMHTIQAKKLEFFMRDKLHATYSFEKQGQILEENQA